MVHQEVFHLEVVMQVVVEVVICMSSWVQRILIWVVRFICLLERLPRMQRVLIPQVVEYLYYLVRVQQEHQVRSCSRLIILVQPEHLVL